MFALFYDLTQLDTAWHCCAKERYLQHCLILSTSDIEFKIFVELGTELRVFKKIIKIILDDIVIIVSFQHSQVSNNTTIISSS